MKKQKIILATILTAILFTTSYLTISQKSIETAKSNTPTIEYKQKLVVDKKKVETKQVDATNAVSEKEAVPAQSEPIASSNRTSTIPSEDTHSAAAEVVVTEPVATTKNPNEIPVQLTDKEAAASQQDPITIDLAYQGTWKSVDGSQTIIGDQYGYRFEGSPIGWLVRYAKIDNGIVFGNSNYFTFIATLASEDHLVITKTDGTQTIEFTRVYQ